MYQYPHFGDQIFWRIFDGFLFRKLKLTESVQSSLVK